MDNNLKTTAILKLIGFTITVSSCIFTNQSSKIKQSPPITNNINFVTRDSAFNTYINGFNDVMLPYNFVDAWTEIGLSIKNEASLKSKYIDTKHVQDVLAVDQNEILKAYKIPFHENIIGLVYTATTVLTHQVILVTYNDKGIVLCAHNIHGNFNDGEYKLNGILNTDLTVSVSDSVYHFDGRHVYTKFRQSYNLQVDSYGQIIKTDIKELTKNNE